MQMNLLCAHKISLVQHFTRTHRYLERHVWNMCRNILGRNIYVRSKFSSVRSSLSLYASVRAHPQLRENIALGRKCLRIEALFNSNLFKSIQIKQIVQ